MPFLRCKESAGTNNLQILYSHLNSMMHSISFRAERKRKSRELKRSKKCLDEEKGCYECRCRGSSKRASIPN